MMSLSFMISSSWPSSLTSVPDHFPNSTRQLAGFVAATRADGGNFALRRLFLGTVRNDDAARGLLFGVDALDHNAVVKRTEFHAVLLGFCDYFLD